MANTGPDIHKLFCYYNSLYFKEALAFCFISWAPNPTSMAASCDFEEEGLCQIQLSPLLKSCSSADLKNILLHEMIHAFLWIEDKNRNRSDHGSAFWKMANLINSNHQDDDQRPSIGYKITAKHGLRNEEDDCKAQPWMDLTKRTTNEEPLPNDCAEKKGVDDCSKHLCECHRHSKLWFGRCEKTDDASGLKNKGKKSIGTQEKDGNNHRDLSQLNGHAKEIKNKRAIKRPKIMAEFLTSFSHESNNLGKYSSLPDCTNNNNQALCMDLQAHFLVTGADIPRQRRTFFRKPRNLTYSEENVICKRRREINLVIPMFGVYTDEESGDDLEALINKRSERRKKMKLASNSFENKNEHTTTKGSIPCEVISLD